MLKNKNKSTLISLCVYVLLLVLFCIYDACGLVASEDFWITPWVVVAFIIMGVALYFRESLVGKLEPYHKIAKPLICVLLIILGFCIAEQPYNNELFSMDFSYAITGIIIFAVLFCVIFFAGQQSKTAAIIFLIVCFIWGLANYFVVLFKGQPILPSDLFALETAAAVSGGYVYFVDQNVTKGFVGLAFAILLALFLPKPEVNKKHVLINTSIALVGALVFGLWFNTVTIATQYRVKVDVWSSFNSYKEQGSFLCFLSRIQELTPIAPEGYSAEIAKEITDQYIKEAGMASHSSASTTESPSVVVIMNETFSDLSEYEIFIDSYSGPSFYQSLAESSLQGTAYVSALAGGTCNSEFEFLTGSTMSTLGGGVYPYVLYDLNNIENLASYFNTLGYETTAIHPAERANWRRDQVYAQLGFEQFYDIELFTESDTLRDLPTDKATYDVVLATLKNADEPQFIFDVTIQNHSGYETGKIPTDMQVEAPIKGTTYEDINEYVSCIEQSDKDLAYLIEELRSLDKPVIVCFFGDHQPTFADRLAELEYNKTVSELTLEEVQKRYTIPYMIWKNYDETAGATSEITDNTSLNYLGALLVEQAELPLTENQQFLLSIRNSLPALNLNGYMDENFMWHWVGEESGASEAYHDYDIVQYDKLFNKSSS